MSSLYGSICLSDIPRSQMKKIMCKDGKERIFLNIFVGKGKNLQPLATGRIPTSFLVPPKKRNARTVRITSLEIFKPTSRNRTPPLPNRWPQPQAYHLLTTCLSDSL